MGRLVLVALFCTLWVLPHSASGGSILLTPTPAQAGVDSIIGIAVTADQISGVHGYSVTVSYDPARVRCVRAVKRTYLSGQTLFFATIDSIAGTVRIDEAILGTGVQSGSGTMALIEFRGRQPGVTSLSFTGADVRDAANQGITVTTAGSILTITGTADVRGGQDIPARFELGQNYPNPCNPSTVIPYTLPVAGHVAVDILSVTGEHVGTLVDEVQAAGYHAVQWDPSRAARMVSSGTYFCVMRSGDFRAMTKILVIK